MLLLPRVLLNEKVEALQRIFKSQVSVYPHILIASLLDHEILPIPESHMDVKFSILEINYEVVTHWPCEPRREFSRWASSDE